MGITKLFSGEKVLTEREKLDGWRQELWEALPEIFRDEEDRYGMNEDGDLAIRKGGVTLFVNFGVDSDDIGWVIIHAALVHLPEDGVLAFYRKVLDINNDQSVVGRLSTHEDAVYLSRTVLSDGRDVRVLVSTVATMAQEADCIAEYLVEEFGARPVEVDVIAA